MTAIKSHDIPYNPNLGFVAVCGYLPGQNPTNQIKIGNSSLAVCGALERPGRFWQPRLGLAGTADE